MEVSSLIVPVLIGVFVFGIAAVVYWFYTKTKKKKITYEARVWEAIGSLDIVRDEKGNTIKTFELENLKLFALDVIDKIDVGQGLTPYRLVKINEPVPEVKAKHITRTLGGKKEVNVLKDGDNYTLLTFGLDKETRRMVFKSMPYDLSNMLQNQYYLKMNKFSQEKDHFKVLATTFTIVMMAMALIGCAYFIGQAWVKGMDAQETISKNLLDGQREIAHSIGDLGSLVRRGNLVNKEGGHLGVQEDGEGG